MEHVIISPSILAANFVNLERDIRKLEEAGIEELHLDVMDGHFVNNISIGLCSIAAIRNITKLKLDVHLMVQDPDCFIDRLGKIGVDSIAVHVEVCKHLYKTLEKIKSLGIESGVVLNPGTDFAGLKYLAEGQVMDRVLVMSVEPGFGGQSYIEMSTKKIMDLATWRLKYDYQFIIQVDGGINLDNIKQVVNAGASDIVIGSSVFKDGLITENINSLTERIKS